MRIHDYKLSYLSKSFHPMRDRNGSAYGLMGAGEAVEGIVRADQYSEPPDVYLCVVVAGQVHMRVIEGKLYTERGLTTLARRWVRDLHSAPNQETGGEA